jgi:murein DD-endopeptidase MepM/ murein hydrolase activator NlpD
MITYKVQHGDTLYTIAHRFGVCVGMIALSNNILGPHQIFEGQELLVPIGISNKNLNFRNHKSEYDLETIRKIFSQEGTTAGGVLKFTFPRFDLKVKIDGIIIEPDLALTSWVAFNQLGNHSMMMGDLVLLENEVDPVMSSLIENGIEVTGLHNHLLHESPRIMYLHIKGEGDLIKLAQGVRNALSLTTTPFNIKKQQPPSQIDWKVIEDILGHKGSHKGKVLQLSVPRTKIISEDGHKLPPAMGISHAINFQSVGRNVATTGDFVLLADEVNPVINILRKNNIAVTAIHNHMLTEVPRLFFMHFWAVDKPEKLAQAFKSVLDLAK